MSKRINHNEIRTELNNYITHAKECGFEFREYEDFQAYAQLLHEIVQIEYANLQLEKDVNMEKIKELTHQLDSLSGLWVTDQPVTDDDKNKYHMWRLK